MMYATKDFMGKPAPPNYIPGSARGATGFTTRSDIGPAKEPVFDPNADLQKDEDGNVQDPDNESGLFNSVPYEQDDEEADRTYALIDKKMDERRKSRREERERQELLQYRKERPKIQQQFADLKRGLGVMSKDDWENIPDVGDLVGKNRKKAVKERYTAVPDSILEKAREDITFNNAIDSMEQQFGGFNTPAPDSGMLTDFIEIGKAHKKAFSVKLDQITDSASGKSTVDPRGYLTDLNSVILKTDAELGDIKKARLLLKSVTSTNPKHPPGWIAAARLEEVAGKLVQARTVIDKGTEECPDSEDVWLEAARLNTSKNAKKILANAVRHLPQSVKIWMQAAKLEEENSNKKKVYRRALEFVPTSIVVWQAAIRLEEDMNEAKVLLSEAVKLIPTSVELWLALAKLESFENAKKVLGKARKEIPTSHEIWIAGAQLMAEHGDVDKVDTMIKNAVVNLEKNGAVFSREQWIEEAEKCELHMDSIPTCQAIIRATIGMNVDREDQEDVWLEDAEASAGRGAYETARAIYAFSLKEYPEKKSIWLQAAQFEKKHGTIESLDELLARGVQYCPQAEFLWLMRAKEMWLNGELGNAKNILEQAFIANPKSEQIYLAAAKLEVENKEYQRAQTFFEKARENANTEKVWMKSIVLERMLGNFKEATNQLDVANERFPEFDKLWMIRGQIESEDLKDIEAARKTFARGLKKCPKSIALWILSSKLEENADLLIKARSIMERARMFNPKSPELWVAAIHVENRSGNTQIAKNLLAKALQECPDSGLLWSEAILMEPKTSRKSKITDAIARCDKEPRIPTCMGRIFWSSRKYDSARKAFAAACTNDPDYGDAWAYWYKLESQEGTSEAVADVVRRWVKADPKHGEVWTSISKAPSNYFLRGEELLKTVSEALEV